MGGRGTHIEEGILIEVKEKTEEPPLYKVFLHNDDYTTKEFVVQVLVSIFNKTLDEASQLMWHVHRNGLGVCGVYPFQVAETKIKQVKATSREHGFPLKMTMEPE